MNGLAASRPWATTSSVGAVAPSNLMRFQDFSVASASTIMIATSSPDDAAGDDHVEHGALPLGVARERDPLAVDERDAHAGDGAGERQAGQLRRERRGVDRERVVRVVRVDRQHGDDDLDLVAQALDEQGAQRAVDQAAGEDRLGATGGPRGGRTSRGSCRRRTSAPRRRPSAGRSRTAPSGACRPWWRPAASSRRRGRRRRSRRPAWRGGRSRSGRCGCRSDRCRSRPRRTGSRDPPWVPSSFVKAPAVRERSSIEATGRAVRSFRKPLPRTGPADRRGVVVLVLVVQVVLRAAACAGPTQHQPGP